MFQCDRSILMIKGWGQSPVKARASGVRGNVWLRVLIGAAVFSLACLLGFRQLKGALCLRGESERLAFYAQKYAKSIACVAVEYWVMDGNETAYEGLTFGTAFLADRQGRLLTNCHVACPWLNDGSFGNVCQSVRDKGGAPEFRYRMWVWFDGARALRNNRDMGEAPHLEDVFVVDSAYRTDANTRSVAVVGVRPRLGATAEASLDSDVAVLQVAPVPKDLEPLPLSEGSSTPGRLESVLALGFPMGVQTMPDAVVTASAAAGHIRRCFKNMIQVDVSLHTGNSGGPVVDARGRVIGIASQVCCDESRIFAQPQSDMGQVLPIACASGLLGEVVSGKPQWNGVVDPGLDVKLERLWRAARAGDRSGACRTEGNMRSLEPARLLAGASLHAGGGDLDTALARLKDLMELYPDCAEGSFLRLLLTRGQLPKSVPSETARLLELDWRSEKEFYGYLARVVAGRVPLRETQDGWDDPSERAMLDLVVGLLLEDKRDYELAEALYTKSVIGLGDADVWKKELAWSALERVQAIRSGGLASTAERRQRSADVGSFLKRAETVGRSKKKVEERMKKFARICDEEGEIKALSVMAKAEPLDAQYPIALVFELAKEGRWLAAAEACRRIKPRGGRESANRLGIGLMRVQLLRLAGNKAESEEAMRSFLIATKDPWYRVLARVVSGSSTEHEAAQQASDDPAKQVTLHTALGLMLEARGDIEAAAENYRQALDSGLSDWYEYNLAKARIERLCKRCNANRE